MKRQLLFINGGLLVVVIALAVLLARTYQTPHDMPDVTGSGGTGSGSILVPVLAGHQNPNDGKNYEIIGERDLFRPERRPYKPPTPTPNSITPTPTPDGTPVPPPKGLKLVGILKLGRMRVALISESSIEKGEPQRYRVGDQLKDYTVQRITSEIAVLSKPSAEPIELPLRDKENLLASAEPAQPVVDSRPQPQRPQRNQPQQVSTPVNNPFPFLKKALEKAREEAEQRGYEVPDVEEVPPLPPFLQNLGAGRETDDDFMDDEGGEDYGEE